MMALRYCAVKWPSAFWEVVYLRFVFDIDIKYNLNNDGIGSN